MISEFAIVLVLLVITGTCFVTLALYAYRDRSMDAAFKLRGSNDYEVHIDGQKAIFIVKADSSRDAVRKVKLFIETK